MLRKYINNQTPTEAHFQVQNSSHSSLYMVDSHSYNNILQRDSPLAGNNISKKQQQLNLKKKIQMRTGKTLYNQNLVVTNHKFYANPFLFGTQMMS